MRLLHTSDWHLGRFLTTVSLVEHQRDFLAWLADQAKEQQVDVILVSGDVHDRAIPSVDAVQIFEDSLVSLVAVCPVILISGNHDSAARLGFAAELLAAVKVHLRSAVRDIDRPVAITDREGVPYFFYGIPYLEPEVVRGELGSEKSHAAVLTSAMDLVRADLTTRRQSAALNGAPEPRAVVLAHAFITGGTSSESERDVSVGGVADAPASVFDGVDYVALGHLHGPQDITNPDGPPVRYSGSPLAYSFSEESHLKSISIVDLDASGGVQVTTIPVPVPRSLRTVTGNIDYLLSDPGLVDAEDCWLRAIITDPRRPENPMERIRQRFPHAIDLSWAPHVDGVPLPQVDRLVDPAHATPFEVITAFVEHVTSLEVTADEEVLIRDSIERVRQAEALA